MKFTHLSLLLFLSLLVTTALASGRIALVRLSRGLATVDGKPLQSPLLVSENAVLAVSDNSRVRIQLLGSNRELTVEGPTQLILRGAELKKQASAIKRLPVAVAAVNEGGSNNRPGAAVERAVPRATQATRSARPVPAPAPPPPPPPSAGAAPSASAAPEPEASPWSRPLVPASPLDAKAQTLSFLAPIVVPLPTQVSWSISDPQDNGRVVAEGTIDGPTFEQSVRAGQPVFSLPKSLLQESHGYELRLTCESETAGPYITTEAFRRLSAEEKTVLEDSVAAAAQLTNEQEKMVALVDAGLLAYGWNQWPQAQKFLQESKTLADWQLLDDDTRLQADKAWSHLFQVLGQPTPITSGVSR